MDRPPLPPPFPVGTRLRQISAHRSWTGRDGQRIPLEFPGREVVITETRPGRRGTLRVMHEVMDEYDEEDIIDTTRDAYSIYQNAAGDGWIIWPDRAGEWEVICPA